MRNNPTWTIDKEYWWNPFSKSYYSSHYRHEHEPEKTGPFQSGELFISEVTKPKFSRPSTVIGFNK